MKELTPIDCAVFGSEQMVVNSLEMFLIGEVRIETQSRFKMPLVREEVITDPVVLKIISYLKENIGQKSHLRMFAKKSSTVRLTHIRCIPYRSKRFRPERYLRSALLSRFRQRCLEPSSLGKN